MADQPHEWVILNDYAKNVITLGTSLLALSVTFAEKLGGSSPHFATRVLLYIIWFGLGFATVCGVLIAALLFGFLHRKSRLEEIENELAQTGLPPADVAALQDEKANKLRGAKERNRALTVVTNGSYVAIGFAVIGFCFLGIQPRSSTSEMSKLVKAAAKEAGAMRNVKPADLKVISVDLSPSGDIYSVQLMPSADAVPWVLEISASDGRIRKFR